MDIFKSPIRIPVFTNTRRLIFSGVTIFWKLIYILNFLYTYLLTPWSIVLLEKLTGSAASQQVPHIFGARRFLTILTSARRLSLSWANSIQSPYPLPTSWRSILILSSHELPLLTDRIFYADVSLSLCDSWIPKSHCIIINFASLANFLPLMKI